MSPKRHWLLKTDPETFSWDDLWKAPQRTTFWDGVRNFQARNLLRDEIQEGDEALIYHSGGDAPAVIGIAEIVRAGYPDRTAFERGHDHFDPKSDPEKPSWYMVDVRAVRPLKRPVTLAEMRETRGLERMVLLRKGSRLSVQPVSPEEWRIVIGLGS